jgi:hypothetical protein
MYGKWILLLEEIIMGDKYEGGEIKFWELCLGFDKELEGENISERAERPG